MPYKDVKRNREYQKEWQRRKAAGEDTRIVGPKQPLTHEERLVKRRIYERERAKRLKQKRDEVWGSICVICRSASGLVLHRKDGSPHKLKGINCLPSALKEPEKWTRLCKIPCHEGVHFCMARLGMSWDDIISLLQ